MLKYRLIFGALLIAALVAAVWADDRASPTLGLSLFGDHLRSTHGLLVTAIVAALVVLGTVELRRLLVGAGHQPSLFVPIIFNVALVATPFLAANARDPNAAYLSSDYRLTIALLVAAMLGSFIAIMIRNRTEGAAAAVATTLFMILYLGLLPAYLVRIRVTTGGGAWLLLYVVGVAKCSDIGAYFTGLAVGRHRLIPWLSPKKTIEGLFGGMALAGLVAVVASALVHAFAAPDVAASFPATRTALVFGLLASLVGQYGDLFESLLKRDARAKDSAAAIPAFGGILDLLDSLLFVAPLAFAMLIR